jgi:hypothetical protein
MAGMVETWNTRVVLGQRRLAGKLSARSHRGPRETPTWLPFTVVVSRFRQSLIGLFGVIVRLKKAVDGRLRSYC